MNGRVNAQKTHWAIGRRLLVVAWQLPKSGSQHVLSKTVRLSHCNPCGEVKKKEAKFGWKDGEWKAE